MTIIPGNVNAGLELPDEDARDVLQVIGTIPSKDVTVSLQFATNL